MYDENVAGAECDEINEKWALRQIFAFNFSCSVYCWKVRKHFSSFIYMTDIMSIHDRFNCYGPYDRL